MVSCESSIIKRVTRVLSDLWLQAFTLPLTWFSWPIECALLECVCNLSLSWRERNNDANFYMNQGVQYVILPWTVLPWQQWKQQTWQVTCSSGGNNPPTAAQHHVTGHWKRLFQQQSMRYINVLSLVFLQPACRRLLDSFTRRKRHHTRRHTRGLFTGYYHCHKSLEDTSPFPYAMLDSTMYPNSLFDTF